MPIRGAPLGTGKPGSIIGVIQFINKKMGVFDEEVCGCSCRCCRCCLLPLPLLLLLSPAHAAHAARIPSLAHLLRSTRTRTSWTRSSSLPDPSWIHRSSSTNSFRTVLGRPLSASLAAVPAVIAGHRCTCGPFRAQLQRSTDSECITRDLPENVPCSYFVPNSINTVLPRYLYL